MKPFYNIVDGTRTAVKNHRWKLWTDNPPAYRLERIEDLYISYANYVDACCTSKIKHKDFEIWLTSEI